ncbi:hypothetical protein BU26DRAFT_519430 [Trematosphaeria pertusa]|uniref:Uncharacterized protein n=1 Tax=Trematosphaeria pertusa TaxID=390896 RepID=A0A6A6IHF2_9PLEO|nr:uncharacterized protein BU26DRAFT_519430 [Trematosphaeria pertusa]KAF2249312.1 hypothetical protein BU26DRAFT_519430 [Trematosphaeria pertusa]
MVMEKFGKLVKRKKPSPQPAVPPIEAAHHPKPGDIPITRRKRQLIQPAELRQLRELIRCRYALDVEIWSDRNVKFYQRDRAIENMRKSMAALARIQRTVEAWDKRDFFASDDEYMKFRELKRRVLEEGKRDWASHPPWEKALQNGNANSHGGLGMLDQDNYR